MAGKQNGPARGNVITALETGDVLLEDEESLAFAEGLKACEPGSHFVLHEDNCAIDQHGDGCNCDCLTLVVGAEA